MGEVTSDQKIFAFNLEANVCRTGGMWASNYCGKGERRMILWKRDGIGIYLTILLQIIRIFKP